MLTHLVTPPKFQDSDVPKLQSLKQSELKSGSKKLFKENIKIEVDAKAEDGEVSN
jgi:hypothetical protein